MIQTLLVVFFLFLFFGCLHTHKAVVDQNKKMAYQATQQQTHTEDKELLKIKERLDWLERNSVNKNDVDTALENVRKEIKDFQTYMVNQKKDTATSKNNTTMKVKDSSAKTLPATDLFEQAQTYFKNKQWKKAIFSYEEFRKKEPQSTHKELATLNIGISFMQLGLKKDAQFFFQEVVNQYPQSEVAKQARLFLEQVKN